MNPDLTRWLLTASERDNPHTRLDDAHPGEQAWSTGNLVRPLVDGATYFAELHDVLDEGTGALVLAAAQDAQKVPLPLLIQGNGSQPDLVFAQNASSATRGESGLSERQIAPL